MSIENTFLGKDKSTEKHYKSNFFIKPKPIPSRICVAYYGMAGQEQN